MYEMAIKYVNIFHWKALQNLPKLGFWVWKYTIWQPCIYARVTFCLPEINSKIRMNTTGFSGTFDSALISPIVLLHAGTVRPSSLMQQSQVL
jgi:hypothetical protein